MPSTELMMIICFYLFFQHCKPNYKELKRKMKKLRNVLVALLISIALTWTFVIPSAQAADPGLQFAIEPVTGEFVQFQSGPIYEGDEVFVYYDALRVSLPANPDCGEFEDLDNAIGYVMSGDSGEITQFILKPDSNYVKIAYLTAPECYEGSDEIQVWFEGKSADDFCYDSDFSKNYHFPVICSK